MSDAAYLSSELGPLYPLSLSNTNSNSSEVIILIVPCLLPNLMPTFVIICDIRFTLRYLPMNIDIQMHYITSKLIGLGDVRRNNVKVIPESRQILAYRYIYI